MKNIEVSTCRWVKHLNRTVSGNSDHRYPCWDAPAGIEQSQTERADRKLSGKLETDRTGLDRLFYIVRSKRFSSESLIRKTS